MHTKKWLTIFINIIGGSAVLGSYAHGLLTHPEAGNILWGGVPQSIRPLYTVGMFLAALGYFAFTYFILCRLPPNDTLVADRFGYGIFNALYAAVLIPSALWMPFTFFTVERSSLTLVWTVRLVLVLVALASLGIFVALITVKPHQPLWTHRIAVIGSVFFCIQTVLLDAILWGSLFQLPIV